MDSSVTMICLEKTIPQPYQPPSIFRYFPLLSLQLCFYNPPLSPRIFSSESVVKIEMQLPLSLDKSSVVQERPPIGLGWFTPNAIRGYGGSMSTCRVQFSFLLFFFFGSIWSLLQSKLLGCCVGPPLRPDASVWSTSTPSTSPYLCFHLSQVEIQ